MKYFKQYGMMRTGTNYILSLIEMNFKDAKVFLNLGGWKHGNLIRYPDEKELFEHVDIYAQSRERRRTFELIQLFREEKVDFLIHVENPYLWIISLINLGESKEITNEKVLKHSKEWSSTYRKYRQYLKDDIAYLIRYEDVIKDPSLFLKKIQDKFGLTPKKETFENINNIVLPMHESEKRKFDDYMMFNKKNYYLNPDVKKIFTEEQIHLINKNLDEELMKYFGYSFSS